MCRGIWWATDFTSFARFGADNRGRVGGALSIVVTHRCTTMGMTMSGIPMTVTTDVNAPPAAVPGVTVAGFSRPAGGLVSIW